MTDLEDLAQTPDLVTECCMELPQPIDDEFHHQATTIARRAELEHPINRAPSTMAAAAIYLTGLTRSPRLSQQVIADILDVSAVAIRNCYPKLATAEDITIYRGRGQRPIGEVIE